MMPSTNDMAADDVIAEDVYSLYYKSTNSALFLINIKVEKRKGARGSSEEQDEKNGFGANFVGSGA